jgi:hypothetical protein
MTDRDERGRFLAGNRLASAGGKARAEKLTPEQRHAIAKAGFAALVERRFNGDKQAALDRFHALGLWAIDQAKLPDTSVYFRGAYPPPGACPAGEVTCGMP